MRFLGLAATLFLSGCATIFGDQAGIMVRPTPADAICKVDNTKVGDIYPPGYTLVNPKVNHIVTCGATGYNDAVVIVNSKWSGWLWGDIIAVPPFGFAVDLVSGNGYKMVPPVVDVTLTKK